MISIYKLSSLLSTVLPIAVSSVLLVGGCAPAATPSTFNTDSKPDDSTDVHSAATQSQTEVPTGRLTRYSTKRFALIPGSGVFFEGALWLAHGGIGTHQLIKYDPRSGSQLATIPLEKQGLHFVYVSNDTFFVTAGSLFSGPSLFKINPKANSIITDLKIKGVAGVANGVIFSVDDSHKQQRLLKVDVANGTERGAAPLSPGFRGMLAREDFLWLLYKDKSTASITKIDAESMAVTASINLGNYPDDYFVFPYLVSGEGAIYLNIGDNRKGKIIRIDPDTNQVAAVIDVGGFPMPVVVGGGSIWVSTWVTNKGGGLFPLLRIDPGTNQVIERLNIRGGGNQPWLLATDDAILAIQNGGVQRLLY